MDSQRPQILLIGAGKMGAALYSAWANKQSYDIAIADPKASIEHFPDAVSVHHSIAEINFAPDCIVLAVKPQLMDEVLPYLKAKFSTKPLYLSIAAGKTIGYFENALGNAPIIRAMPNTPALIRKGITALIANAHIHNEQKTLADELMKCAGETVWLDDESQMDAVTALSGSGPAYVFLFMDLLTQAGISHGLPEAMAKKLAVETVHGAAELARKSNESLEQLRINVTSPGGTTEAALKILMQDKALNKLVDSAITEAVKRSKELAN